MSEEDRKFYQMSEEDLKYYRLAQGVIAGIKIHHEDEYEIARYLKQYVKFKEGV